VGAWSQSICALYGKTYNYKGDWFFWWPTYDFAGFEAMMKKGIVKNILPLISRPILWLALGSGLKPMLWVIVC
jgi:hypothetical protein